MSTFSLEVESYYFGKVKNSSVILPCTRKGATVQRRTQGSLWASVSVLVSEDCWQTVLGTRMATVKTKTRRLDFLEKKCDQNYRRWKMTLPNDQTAKKCKINSSQYFLSDHNCIFVNWCAIWSKTFGINWGPPLAVYAISISTAESPVNGQFKQRTKISAGHQRLSFESISNQQTFSLSGQKSFHW